MDLYAAKSIKPMLIGADGEPFDNPDYIFELKLDGERCIAYLDPEEGTDLRNKRNFKMLSKVPELSRLHEHIRRRCILDGELFVLLNGKPNFSMIQRRSLMSNSFKIDLLAKEHPAAFTAFDILYDQDKDITGLPLTERKKRLQQAVKEESPRFAVSRCIEEKGTAFYALAKQQDLEGVVAKRKDSRYYFDKRTKDWIKIKNLQDEDFAVCGYIYKENHMVSLILGQYNGSELLYKGHVTLGVGGRSFQIIKELPAVAQMFHPVPPGNEAAVWVEPVRACTVKYMEKLKNGSMRQPVFKGLRDDKTGEECIVN